MTAKDKGLSAPDGSLYGTFTSSVTGVQAADGALKLKSTDGNGNLK